MKLSAAEFKAVRETFKFSVNALARELKVSARSVARWESGERPVPDGIIRRLKKLLGSMDIQARIK